MHIFTQVANLWIPLAQKTLEGSGLKVNKKSKQR